MSFIKNWSPGCRRGLSDLIRRITTSLQIRMHTCFDVWTTTTTLISYHNSTQSKYQSKEFFVLKRQIQTTLQKSILSNRIYSSGMMRKMGRRRRSGRKTSPCSPSSARRLEVTTKTRPTRHTASSLIGGWRASTHCDDNTAGNMHTYTEKFPYSAQTDVSLAQMWRNFMKHLMFRSPICTWN